MENSNLLILVVLFMMTAVSESGVLVPRDLASAKNELPFGRDKKLGLFPASKNPEQYGEDDFGVYEYETGGIDPHGPPNYDHGKPEGGDKKKPGKEPEIFFPDPDEERIQKPDENSEDKKGEDDEDRNDDKNEEDDEDRNDDKNEEDDEDRNDDKNEEDDEDRNDEKENDLDKNPGEEGFYEPFDGEEDSDKSDDKDSKIPDGIKPDDEDEDKKEPGEDYDGNDEKPEEENDTKVPEDDDDDENNDKKGTEGEDDDKKVAEEDNEEKPEEEDDREEHLPLPGDDDEKSEDEENNDGGEEGFLSGGSIFDNPIFNLEQVQKYFRQLEKALGLVFKQTLDEALLLNGTYANTTEEEVEINGKKYIVQKSIIKGADNHSAIYVEALSTIPKGSNTTEPKYDEAKNETDV